MSQENVKLARRAIEAWNRDGPQAAEQYAAQDFEYHDPAALPDAKVIRGREAVTAHFAANDAAVAMRFTIKQALQAGEDAVVLLMEVEAHGTGSEIAMSGPFAQVLEFRDGEIRRTRSFLTWAEALEAVGLTEQDAHADS
jgi:ketosteroid isomerase-like protein